MANMGYHWGVAGQYGTGNRPRIDFIHCRADDVETMNLEMADADLLLLMPPSEPLERGPLKLARWRMQRRAYSFVIQRLRQRGISLRREPWQAIDEEDVPTCFAAPYVHWAWLSLPDD